MEERKAPEEREQEINMDEFEKIMSLIREYDNETLLSISKRFEVAGKLCMVLSNFFKSLSN